MKAAGSILQVGLDIPGDYCFDYLLPEAGAHPFPIVGQRVLVPWSKKSAVGVVFSTSPNSQVPDEKLKPALAWLTDAPALSTEWLNLVSFAAKYYLRGKGEAAMQCMPSAMRDAQRYRYVEPDWRSPPIERARRRIEKEQAELKLGAEDKSIDKLLPRLNPDQQAAVERIRGASGPVVLHGVTGSGKTEVYLAAVSDVLDAGKTAIVLVPEINLTPQLLGRFEARFPRKVVLSLHSGLTDAERTLAWLASSKGHADVLVGTRMAVFVDLPDLGLIVVDEEHDGSYKQQEGLRYSARDLAIWRASTLKIPVVLGSATPSLESWAKVQQGKYALAGLPQRAHREARLPTIEMVDSSKEKSADGLAPSVLNALRDTLARGEQSLVFLNRRGYAPVLACSACGWVGGCTRCTAHLVMHGPQGRLGARLRCHHCGWEAMLPRHCPTCGNADLAPLGRGTQRIEETLAHLMPQARLARIDADSTRRKGSAEKLFAQVHEAEVDILIGTQMVAKGHDFARVSLVAVLGADAALYSHDFRAAERLFAQLMQVAGRAGRAHISGRVMVQTRYPAHPLYDALQRHDYPMFAHTMLDERRDAGMPPYSYHAILRAEAKLLDDALAMLRDAAQLAREVLSRERNARDVHASETGPGSTVHVYDPVPMTLTRLADVERAQLLVESASRTQLHGFLEHWLAALGGRASGRKAAVGGVKWQIEVDPLDI